MEAKKNTPALKPYIFLVLGIMGMSLNFFFIRRAQAPGLVTAAYKMSLASLALLPFMLRHMRRPEARAAWRRSLGYPLLGGVMLALTQATLTTAFGYTRVANASLLDNLAPVWVGLFSLAILREKLGGRFWLGLGLALGGAGVLLGSRFTTEGLFGDLLALVSGVTYAGYFIATQEGRRRLDTLPYLWTVVASGGLGLALSCLAAGKPLFGYPLSTYLAFLGVALIPQVIGYFSVAYALGHLPASLVAPVVIAQPVLSALLAVPLVGENLEPLQLLGGLGVAAGIFIILRDQQK